MCYELGFVLLLPVADIAMLCFIAPCSQICCMYYELGFVLLLPVALYVACIMSYALFYCSL